MYRVVFTKIATKDTKKLKAAGLDQKTKQLIEVVASDPFAYPLAFKQLVGNLAGMFSRRVNWQHRFLCEVIDEPFEVGGVAYDGTVKVLSMWTHYDSV